MKLKFSLEGIELDIPAAGRVLRGVATLLLIYELPRILAALRWW